MNRASTAAAAAGHTASPILPPQGPTLRWLAVVMAVMCFLAGLAAVGASSAHRAASGWAQRLGTEVTVQVRPGVGETGLAASGRAAETLAGLDGVLEARAMTREQAEALVRPWVGDAVVSDLPLPHLVTVQLDPEAPASAASLSRALASAGLDATVDDHSQWKDEIRFSAMTLSGLAALAFLLTAAGAGAAIVYATKAGLAADGALIQILGQLGATDATIAGLYQRRFVLLALSAGLGGAIAAAIPVVLLRLIGGWRGLTPALPVAWTDLVLLLLGPLMACALAWLAARRTVLSMLARQR